MSEQLNSSSSTNPEPTIRQSDFPEKSSRLQELLANYKKENNIPDLDSEADSSLEGNSLVRKPINTKLVERDFDDLSDEEKQFVLSTIDGTDYSTSRDIQTFASTKESPLTKNAELIISKHSTMDLGDLANPMTDLVATLKSNNPKELVSRIKISDKVGLADFFSLKNAKKRLQKMLAQNASIINNIKAIEVKLKEKQMGLMNDIDLYEAMGKDTVKQVVTFELSSIALGLMSEDATLSLNQLNSKDSLTPTEYSKATDLQKAIERMNRKKFSIKSVQTSTIQTIPQLSVLITGNEIICEKIDEVLTLIIPLWEWQYAIALGALAQKESLSILNSANTITSTLLRGNAELLHDNMIAAQEDLYKAAVAIDDLLIVQEYIDDMISKVNETSRQAAQECVEGMKKMKSIDAKNIEIMNNSIQ